MARIDYRHLTRIVILALVLLVAGVAVYHADRNNHERYRQIQAIVYKFEVEQVVRTVVDKREGQVIQRYQAPWSNMDEVTGEGTRYQVRVGNDLLIVREFEIEAINE